MTVKVKDLSVEMEVKNKGIEFEVRDAQDKFQGDLIVTGSSVIWCEGKTARENGVKVKMSDFLNIMRSQSPAAKKAAKQASVAPAKKAAPAKKVAK
ncbi:hypothetical protein [Achromobacter pestifer]